MLIFAFLAKNIYFTVNYEHVHKSTSVYRNSDLKRSDTSEDIGRSFSAYRLILSEETGLSLIQS
jgi:hypothetical protein